MNRRVFFMLAFGAVSAVLAACAAGGAGAGSGTDRELLTREDLAPYQTMDAYQVIRRLRGFWLTGRGALGSARAPTDPSEVGVLRADNGGEGQVQVYIDGIRRAEGVDALRDLQVDQVREIRHLDSRDATMQFGTDHGAGAIMVSTGIG